MSSLTSTTRTLTVPSLNLSTSEINQEIRKSEKILQDTELKRAIERSKENQLEKEKEFIKGVNFCAPYSEEFSRFLLSDFNENNVRKLINNKFYDFESLEALSCALDSIFISAPEYGSTVKLEYYLRNLRQIGAPSVEGIAVTADLKGIEKAFVLKAPRISDKTIILEDEQGVVQNLLHEYVVGVQLNELRRIVPNFARTHGAIIGSSPITNEQKQVIDWGKYEEEKTVRYIVYENISPGEDLNTFGRDCTFESWLNVYLQTLYALHIAQKLLGFSHYDLHDGNVIVRRTDLPKPMYIPYETENGIEFMSCGFISTIIDFGFSSIETKDGNFGEWDFMDYGVYPEHVNPLHDAYKLLLMSMSTQKLAGNTRVFDKCREILRFFNDKEKAEKIITDQWPARYSLPYNNVTKNTSIFDLTQFIRSKFSVLSSKFFSEPSIDKKTVSCINNELCLTKIDAVGEIIGTGRPTDIFSFFDLYTSKTLQKSGITIEDLTEEFREVYPEAMEKFYNEIKNIYEEKLTEKPEVIAITGLERSVILENAGALQKQIYNSLEKLNNYLYLADLLDIARSVGKIYNDTATLEKVYDLIKMSNKWYLYFEQEVFVVIEDNIVAAGGLDLSGLDKRTVQTVEQIVGLHKRIVNMI